MGIEFARPWLLLALLPAAAIVLLPYWKREKDARLWFNMGLRLAILTILTLALAGASLLLPGGKQALMLLADRSDSMGDAAAEKALIADIEQRKGTVQTGLISFGGNTGVEYLSGSGQFAGFDTKIDGSTTAIADALSLGSALLPQDSVRRVLLMTDGLENKGDILAAARRLAASGVRMDVAYFPPQEKKEAQATSLSIPGYLHIGETCDIVVTLNSNTAGKATLRLYCDRAQVGSQEVELQKGENRFVFPYKADAEGIHTWSAELTAQWDTDTANNRADGFTRVIGKPAVLLAADADAETAALAQILQSAGFIVERKHTAELPTALDDYMKYQAVVLCNVPADSLGEEVMAALDAYVRLLGRGLLVTGGQNSFALGGYEGTKLEEMLPVDSRVENYAQLPKLGLVLVIDKSGSMEAGQYGVSKRDLAVEAAARSVTILQPKDDVGVIAFDDQAAWAVPMTQATDKAKLQEQISTIRIGGGTMMYTPMLLARDALMASNAQLKHVILLTDGQPADSGFQGVAQDMRDSGITLSTVAVGKDADISLLKSLAEIGGGRSYVVDEFSNIVSVFTKETYLATGAYLQNRTFTPAATTLAPAVLSQGLPQLHGYVNTTPKQMAEVQLVSDRDHTIYARRRWGLGRTAAWTSDVKGLWTQDLLASANAVRVVSSLVQQVLPENEGSGALDAAVDGGQATVRLQADTAEGSTAKATVIAPDNSTFTVPLSPTQPGQYEAKFDTSQPGVYIVKAAQSQPGAPDVMLETGVSTGWSREYDLRREDPQARLQEAARITGGTLLSTAEELFAQSIALKRGRWDAAGALLITALFLFLADVALRRMRWDARLVQWAAARSAALRRKHATKPIAAPAHAPVSVPAEPAKRSAAEQPKAEQQKAEPAKPQAEQEKNAAMALLDKRKQQKRF